MTHLISSNDKIFLTEKFPEGNLEILSNFKPSHVSGTFCSTKKVYQKTPYFAPSHQTIREATIFSAASFVFSSIVLSPFINIGFCMATKEWQSNFIATSSECFQNATTGSKDSRAHMITLIYASTIGLLSMGAYGAARMLLNDGNQSQRFELLNQEYSAVAQTLLDKFNAASGKGDASEIEKIKNTALKLKFNRKYIKSSLENTIRLTPSQADLLTMKLSTAAKAVLYTPSKDPAA